MFFFKYIHRHLKVGRQCFFLFCLFYLCFLFVLFYTQTLRRPLWVRYFGKQCKLKCILLYFSHHEHKREIGSQQHFGRLKDIAPSDLDLLGLHYIAKGNKACILVHKKKIARNIHVWKSQNMKYFLSITTTMQNRNFDCLRSVTSSACDPACRHVEERGLMLVCSGVAMVEGGGGRI